MVIVSAGIRPRDELARACGLDGRRARRRRRRRRAAHVSDPHIFAIGEVALHRGMIYGLVAPGYEMAEVARRQPRRREHATFTGADLSTKLKLMGVDVASFGDSFADEQAERTPIIYEDPFSGVYKKLRRQRRRHAPLGGILVGDAADYATLLPLAKSGDAAARAPRTSCSLGSDARREARQLAVWPTTPRSARATTSARREICDAIRDRSLATVGEVKACTKAGTGCGGCLPLVTDLFNAELAAPGKTVKNASLRALRLHAPGAVRDRQDQAASRRSTSSIASHGTGHGCEICKPAVASILASLWTTTSSPSSTTLQDTNDRFLANIQRGGTVLGRAARAGRRDHAREADRPRRRSPRSTASTPRSPAASASTCSARASQQLPDIWEELVEAGFESGHAYGKALRTVKSCVGTTWCRYGVQDSVGFAIRVENRYKGIRAPHKIKSAVSGCVRECAEAQSKDFGLIATEKGWNLYVCGNGGAKPRHADLLAADLDEETAIKYIDRFLMYYIQTADRLTRTSVWLEKMEGGIDYLRDVDRQRQARHRAELERQMQHLVDTYECEWADVVNDPGEAGSLPAVRQQPAGHRVRHRGRARPARPGRLAEHVGGQQQRRQARTCPSPSSTKRWVQVAKVKTSRGTAASPSSTATRRSRSSTSPARGEWYATPEHVPAPARDGAGARHRRRRKAATQGRLPAPQEDVRPGDRRVPARRRPPRADVPRAGRRRDVSSSSRRRAEDLLKAQAAARAVPATRRSDGEDYTPCGAVRLNVTRRLPAPATGPHARSSASPAAHDR